MGLRLVVAGEMELARQRQDQRDRVLGDSALIAALGAGEAHAGRSELLLVELVGAGADRLDETQLTQSVEDLVAPEARDHQHVGFQRTGLEIVEIANLEAGRRSVAGEVFVTQLIGRMGEADGEGGLLRPGLHARHLQIA